MMAVRTKKSVFFHIPKTGGVWVKEAMRHSGLEYDRCQDDGKAHPFGLRRNHSTPGNTVDVADLFSFCFVRHPVTWFQSFWSYRKRSGFLDMHFPADNHWDDDFNTFVNNVLDAYPNGFVTELYGFFIDGVTMIGKQETLATDLVNILLAAGEEFDENILINWPPRNIGASHPKYKRLCIIDDATRKRVMLVEKEIVKRFNYD